MSRAWRDKFARVLNFIAIVIGLAYIGSVLLLDWPMTVRTVLGVTFFAAFAASKITKDGWIAVVYFTGVALLVGALAYYNVI